MAVRHQWAAVLIGLMLSITYTFMKLFVSVADRHIFDQSQVNRLMYVGYCLLGYAVLSLIVKRFVEQRAILYLERFGYSVNEHHVYDIGLVSPTAETVSILTGLCILALAQVFKYGMVLKQENDLTI